MSESLEVYGPDEIIYVRNAKGELLVYLVQPSGAVTLLSGGRES